MVMKQPKSILSQWKRSVNYTTDAGVCVCMRESMRACESEYKYDVLYVQISSNNKKWYKNSLV